jgi:hypothetical protein
METPTWLLVLFFGAAILLLVALTIYLVKRGIDFRNAPEAGSPAPSPCALFTRVPRGAIQHHLCQSRTMPFQWGSTPLLLGSRRIEGHRWCGPLVSPTSKPADGECTGSARRHRALSALRQREEDANEDQQRRGHHREDRCVTLSHLLTLLTPWRTARNGPSFRVPRARPGHPPRRPSEGRDRR